MLREERPPQVGDLTPVRRVPLPERPGLGLVWDPDAIERWRVEAVEA